MHILSPKVQFTQYTVPNSILEGSKDSKKGTRIFVVLNAHLLSEYHRIHIASSVISLGFRLVLVMPSLNPEHQVIRFKLPNTNQNVTLMVWQASDTPSTV